MFFRLSKTPGVHWIVLYKVSEVELELFDSLGTDCNFIKDNLPKYGDFALANITAVQPTWSASCGQFCLYYITMRLMNLDLSFSELLNNIFCGDLNVNEKTVLDFIQ